MIKLHRSVLLNNILSLSGTVVFGVILLTHPQIASLGVKKGLHLLGENLIPSLFPFMILSGYISKSPVTGFLAKRLERITQNRPHVNTYAIIIFILGCAGGYPIGAKTITDFKNRGFISPSEASRLFYWCVNPGASFVITAVGTFMLGNTMSGVIIYLSCVLSSVFLGVFSTFACKATPLTTKSESNYYPKEHVFINSVSSSVEAILGICGWVLFFSTICELSNTFIHNQSLKIFFNSVAEVTIGTKTGIENSLSLPVICAIISFGGLAVAAQISPQLSICGVPIKIYLGWRIAGGAVSAFICSQLLHIFPQCVTVNATLTPTHALTDGIPVALFMVLMCVVLIFEVDNKRNLC